MDQQEDSTPRGSAIGEFELISRLIEVIEAGSAAAPGLLTPIGDDAAALSRPAETAVYTTDTLVDGVHFITGQIPWFDLGWKSMAVNQSDAAAMGATPLHALVTLGVPPGMAADPFVDMYDGMLAALREFGGYIVGGDVVRSPVLFITVALTAAAVVPAEQARRARCNLLPASSEPDPGGFALLRRDRAAPGDLLAVTGTLGASAGGRRAAAEGLPGDDAARLRRTHFRPEPRVHQGRILASLGVRAAIDVSDGLVDDASKLAAASGVNALLFAALVPAHPALLRLFPTDALTFALSGGEDYELLFAAPPALMSAALHRLEMPATVVGHVAPAADGPPGRITVLDEHGREVALPSGGWDHLRA
ncbi:MAG: thiamine-monophosphate kinase [Gemmatimonadetes bacterium]|nr:thiamine-monophosphate kinase [Gemmatimonadota bacterium]